MWRIGRTDAFVRAARRFLWRRPHLEAPVARALALLERDPFDPRLHTHGLGGTLEGLYGVSVTYQVRLVVSVDPARREVVLLDLGDHDAVYR